jgi:hypothetical protein
MSKALLMEVYMKVKSEFEILLSKSIDRRILKITYNSGVIIQGWIQNYNPNSYPSTLILVTGQQEEHQVDIAGIQSIDVVPSPLQL